ncbi:sugar ABC transporter ATP-binding protein [Aquipuribacter hungaricus]|uniref:Sugar ABC transporter ATP-binding protein n=1 Tax=Aquipuribacter hungaricus TaxID=545624 RepID=A0ABV7WHI3_9MICO
MSRSFGATRAVQDISFTIAPGEVLALVGENGAGKSTLMNLLVGALEPDTGSVRVAPPSGPHGRRVAMVHQELSLFDNLTVAENLELDREGGGAVVSERASRASARSVLEHLGVDVSVDATVGSLTVGQRQLVEIAKAVSVSPTLLILDEPTSSLEGPQVALLFAAVRRLAAAGTAVVFVSHRTEELFELCDRLLVMRDGVQVEFGPLAGHTRASLVESMVGRETSTLYPGRAPSLPPEPEIELVDVSLAGRLHGVSLSFPAGAVTAVTGLDGHGQTEVAEILAGATRPASGTVAVHGVPVRFSGPRAAVRRGIGYVPPDRRLDGLLLDGSVAANATLAAAPRVHPRGVRSPRRERRVVQGLVQRLAIKASSLHQPVVELSGGNQQKVLVGRWLLVPGLRVLVLNDPTRGVDVGSRAQIYAVVRDLAASGVAVVLVSTDMQETLGLSDQIYVLYSGRVSGRLLAADATERDVMHHAMGGDARA